MNLTSNVERLIEGFENKDKKALARAMTLVEEGNSELVERIRTLRKSVEEPWIIGITGPPGVGKSTLIDKLIGLLLMENRQIAVFAVDPSSKISGGAILGDRVRMQRYAVDENVFIRSVATRGAGGGVSHHLIDMIDMVLAFGYDTVIVETVGAGQIDLDIFDISDTTVLVLMPEQGDGIQTYKAGMTEMADIFVINKADKQGADKIAEQLKVMRSITKARDEWQPPILKVISTENIGIDMLLRELQRHRRYLLSSKKIEVKKRTRRLMRVREGILSRFEKALSKALENLADREIDDFDEVYIEIVKDILAEGGGNEKQMLIKGISHIGIAVEKIADKIGFYRDILGLKVSEAELVEAYKVKVAFVEIGKTRLELLEPTSEESSIAEFLKNKGEGIHHIAFDVLDIEKAFSSMKKAGIRVLRDSISKGAHGSRVFFIHPKDTGGILMEFVEEVHDG